MTDATAEWVPTGIDEEVPSAARVYDYLLGGGHNFSADRVLAEELVKVMPARDMARMNRQYLDRAVRFLVSQGITQFLDLGSGIPTAGNVHEVAQRLKPGARVVYVDNEAVAVAHSQMILRDNPDAAAIAADMREPESVLGHEQVRRLIDFTEPVGLLMVAATQFIADADDPWTMTRRYQTALAPGSHLALSAFTWDNDPDAMRAAIDVYANSRDPLHPRTRDQIRRLFGDWPLIEPGLVYTPEWRPEREADSSEAPRSNLYAGVAVKN
ncbi:SAM-dependent methyltransferase [Actinosynnema sp. ALI-1.44]|uniref:SAM-dependent methyltransferase n=1 Tax=Actinosynnema sp. ALI-1.44 TaxID=1933779 RepID=UPI001EDBFF42|nr:SAM-dependent methyltransferase [Actinosynnema sp. ALI-1.44]